MFHHYSAPDGFNWDTLGINDPTFQTFNADKFTQMFHDWVLHMKDHYKTNHLLIPFGDDFNYEDAKLNYRNIDQFMAYFNAHIPNITLFYSTPSEYIQAINGLNVTWPTKYDDMFPLADIDNSYWTGFYTSRANEKDYVRSASHHVRAAMKLYGLKSID
jgi:hypothetical protein